MKSSEQLRKQFKENLNKLIHHGKAREIANMIEVGEDTLSTWRATRKTNTPTIIDATRLAQALNVSLAELVGLENKDEALHHPKIKELVNIVAEMPMQKLNEATKLIMKADTLDPITLDLLNQFLTRLEPRKAELETLNPTDRDIVVPEPVVEEPAPPQHVEEPQEEERAEASHKEIPNTTYFSDDKDGEGDYIDYPAYEIAAGQPILGENSNADIFSVHHSEVKNCTPQTHGIVHVRGDSMINAGIPTGCCALIKYHEHPVENAIMAVWLETQEGVTLKRIRKIDGAIWACWENDTDKRLRVGEDPRDRAIGLFVKVLHKVRLR